MIETALCVAIVAIVALSMGVLSLLRSVEALSKRAHATPAPQDDARLSAIEGSLAELHREQRDLSARIGRLSSMAAFARRPS